MALTDVNFQEGEIQDFIIELPTASYSGSIADVLIEAGGGQPLLLEAPKLGDVFIMSE